MIDVFSKDDVNVPHINLKHFPSLSEEQNAALVAALTKAVMEVVQCNESAISIALEPIEKDAWNEQVYIPEIINRKHLLHKQPGY